jgi:hypothetical protein
MQHDLDGLDDLDSLPYGVVVLNDAMTVVRMNRTESERSGIQRWRAIGRDFFRDIAPADAELAGHIRAGTRRFHHTFKRRAGADPTTIELSRSRDRIYLAIYRVPGSEG